MSLSINSVSGHRMTEIEKKFQYQSLGIPDDVISQGTSAIKDYAYENSITLPDFEAQDEEALFEPAEEMETNDAAQAGAAQDAGAGDDPQKLRYKA